MKSNNKGITEISGNKILKIIIWFQAIVLNCFLFFIFYLILFGKNKAEDITAYNMLLNWGAFFIILNTYIFYFLLNIPRKIILYREHLQVIWNGKKTENYTWNVVSIKKIGLNPNPMIIIKDNRWKVMGFSIPRILFLSKWSDKYVLLMNLCRTEGEEKGPTAPFKGK